MNSEIRTPKKIVFMGLDNSGKTSIVLSLKKDVNLLSYYSLTPTHGVDIVNIETQGKQYSVWDCGGQETYRQEYLKNQNYLSNVDKIIYVIDVQDIERYDTALKYLSNLIDLLKSRNISVKLSIFLHKFDPNLEEDPNFSDDKIKTNLIDKIKTIIPSDFEYDIFKTTIYTVFHKIMI
ncbi:MAG: ADP-ribosylation factor-like protein [Candidatus Helarchaeota archaeon]